jgi:hypothetical protein
MQISLTTPALLFPAISLLLLAFTNRFLAIASLIRNLHAAYQKEHDSTLARQINNLRTRLTLIRSMQIFGISALFLCVLCMFLLFSGYETLGEIAFGTSLILMMTSLSLSIAEIQISVQALNIQLRDMEGSNSPSPLQKLLKRKG